MADSDPSHRRNPSTPQSIPLQDLNPEIENDDESTTSQSRRRTLSGRGRTLLRPRESLVGRSSFRSSYVPIGERSPSPPLQRNSPSPRTITTSPPGTLVPLEHDDAEFSPIADGGGFQEAMGFAGLSYEGERMQDMGHTVAPSRADRRNLPALQTTTSSSPDSQENDQEIPQDGHDYFSSEVADTVPLTDPGHLRPSGASNRDPSTPTGQPHDRDRNGFRESMRFLSPRHSGPRLGDDLQRVEAGLRTPDSSQSRSPSRRKRSLSPSSAESPLHKAGTMVRKMSQRVVNLSNEPELVGRSTRRRSSPNHAHVDPPPLISENAEYANDGTASVKSAASEKSHPPILDPDEPPLPVPEPNPLRGRSLGIFPPNSPLRLKLCELLVHPATEPFILVLIVIQTILLAVDSGRSVYDHQRSSEWGQGPSRWVDFALLALFSIYTVEIIIRIIVSGFIINPTEYSTIDRHLGFRRAVLNKANELFALHRKPVVKHVGTTFPPQQPGILRSFTAQNLHDFSGGSRQAQKTRLAHRAFLRHSFTRLDFLAVVSFWISFVIALLGIESGRHAYVFRMLSCLRILRLLGITSGTSVILRSLKRAAPILLNVAFLIGFFWLLFAIVGVQSFKSSLRRTCVWVDPNTATTSPQSNYTRNVNGNFQFCGGHLVANGTGSLVEMPWVYADGTNGTTSHKGYLCPVNSFCVEGENPYNGTVSFDNILQSLELVFVIMTSNTFSDLLYYLTDSDYLAAALFFAFGIVIMSLWLISLLIAVITSSFQVIREESSASAFTASEHEIDVGLEESELKSNRRVGSIKRMYDESKQFWIAVIVYGLVVQCLRSANMSSKRAWFIEASELAVTLLLAFEIVLRFAVDWRDFRHHKRNWVDLGLAVVTLVIQIPSIRKSGQPYAWLTIFQLLRIYRVVLAIQLTRDLILLVLRHVSGVLNLILFVILLTFLAAIFATQLFRGQLPQQNANGDPIYITFGTIYNSFLGMYQILSSENWTIIMYNVTNFNTIYNTAWIGAMFFILWFIVANFIVLNMFIAVIQENFDVSEDEKRLQQVRAFLQHKELGGTSQGNLSLSTIFKFGQARRQDPLDFGSAATEMLLKDAVVRDFLDEPAETSEPPLSHQTSRLSLEPQPSQFNVVPLGYLSRAWSKFKRKLFHHEPNPFHSRLQLSRAYEDIDPRQMAREVVSASERRKIAQREYLLKHPSYNVSLFIFKPNNPIRRMCQRVVGTGRGGARIQGVAPSTPVWYAFSAFIYAAIVAMVLLACVTTPLYQKEYFKQHGFSLKNWFVYSDLGFAVLFTVEAIIKVVADGFFWTPNAYFRGSWGFIDGIVLITLWINVFTSLYNKGNVSRAVGAFKALRALRLLNVSDSARDTFHSVIVMGGWKVLSAALVSLSLLIPFAVYGLNLFNGKLQQCNDGTALITGNTIYNLTDCVGEYLSSPHNWNVLAPRQVSNSYYDFDTFGGSLFILFQIVSQEGWIDVMWAANSITGVFTQPSPFSSQGNGVFFMMFNLLGAVFVLTLFVSVFMRNYTEQTGVAFMTTEQRSWLELRKLLRQISPSKRPSSKKKRENWQEWCYRRAVTKNGWWHRSMTIVLLLHLVLLCMEFYPSRFAWDRTRGSYTGPATTRNATTDIRLDYIFLLLTFLYIGNIFVRVIGLTWTRFRRSSWDLYSVFAIWGTFVTTVLLLTNFQQRDYAQLHKLFLVAVALLLIPRNNQLDQLFKTAAASLTSIGNLLATWFVLFLVFAIALTQTFGLTAFGTHESGNINVRSVPKALILLFRTSVGEGWNQIMEDFATVVPPYCVVGDEYFDGDCGSPEWARAIFILWNILSMYIFVNLFVSLIYESFSYVYQRSSGLSVISREETRRFKQAWAEFDPDGTGYISKEVFPRLLGVSITTRRSRFWTLISAQELSGVFEMRIYDGDFTVRNLMEDCKLKPIRASALPLDGAADAYEIDLAKLNARLAELPIDEIRRRRVRMNKFYEEMMVSADPDRGIAFNTLLRVLAHYKVINDNKGLQLEEFLRRRARLQRVEEAVRRNVVVGFFDTLYWRRNFQRAMDAKNRGRMTAIPQFEVPEIFIQDEGEEANAGPSPAPSASPNLSPVSDAGPTQFPDYLGAGGGTASGGVIYGVSSPTHGGVGGAALRDRSGSLQISPVASPSATSPLRLSAQARPRHRASNSETSIQPEWQFAEALAAASPGAADAGP
ncbi:calcium channel protein, partial [Elasticomyces elasticus]